jgi:hypothetical protein
MLRIGKYDLSAYLLLQKRVSLNGATTFIQDAAGEHF